MKKYIKNARSDEIWEIEVDGRKKKKINYKKMIIAITIVLITIIAITIGVITGINFVNKPKEEKEPEIIIPDDIVINMVATGDIMCHTTNFNAAYNRETKTYDFTPVFANIAKYISKADIAIGNLETTFAGEDRAYTGYPTFNSPEALGYALKNIGIDVLSTANNHSLDKRYTGVVSTLDTLDEIGISHVGTARSQEEQDTILVKDVNGIKIAFIAFTYGTNGIPVEAGKEYSVNLIEEEVMLRQLELAKAQKPDVICASMHWGVEYSQKPSEDQKDLANYLFNHGVDIIIGNHAHVVEPMEKRNITLEDGTEKEVFVVYALGNFVSGQIKEHTKSTAILDMQIRKNGQTGKITIDTVDYVPVYCYDRGGSSQNRYELLDIREEMTAYESGDKEKINQSLYNTLKSELNNIESVLGKPIRKEEDVEG